jgi:hypothetical protein
MGMRSLTAMFPPEQALDQSIESIMSRITPVVPFLQDFQVISSVLDPHARQFPIPNSVTVQSSSYRVGRPMLTPCSLKNLKIVPDSVRTLQPALFTAQILAEKLK